MCAWVASGDRSGRCHAEHMRSEARHPETTRRLGWHPGSAGARSAAGLAVLLVAVAWLVTPHPVPLYDGVGIPDEPYRYVHTPVGAKRTAAPTGGTGRSAVTNGTNSSFLNVFTGESGPQATVNVPDAGVAAPSGPVIVRITPLAPSGQPPGSSLDGNLYQVDITSAHGPLSLTAAASQGAIYQRAPRQVPTEVVLYRSGPGQVWRGLETQQAGNDIWGAVPPGPGQFALSTKAPVVQGPSAAGAGDAVPAPVHANNFPAWAVLLLGVLLALGAVILVIRRRANQAADRT